MFFGGWFELKGLKIGFVKGSGRLWKFRLLKKKLEVVVCCVEDLIVVWMMMKLERRQTVYIHFDGDHSVWYTQTRPTSHASSLTRKGTWLLGGYMSDGGALSRDVLPQAVHSTCGRTDGL